MRSSRPYPKGRPHVRDSRMKEPTDDLEFGEWLRERLLRACGTDEDPWAVQRVEEVRDRLNRARLPLPLLAVVILFEAEVTAFVGPGRYVYVTRGLLHRAWWPESVAMALAHEMAHHDLGHTRVFTG